MVKEDFKAAHDLFDKSCSLGSVEGCTNLGAVYQNGEGVERDYTKAFKLLTQVVLSMTHLPALTWELCIPSVKA